MLKYDFHIHSCLSPCGDGDMTPNNIVNMAALIGLDTIAVTDHNTVGNVKAAMAVGKEAGITVIPGMEVETCEEVHILTLYPSFEAAKIVADIVYDSMAEIKNKPGIFGEQIYMNENDEVVGYEEKLLITSSGLSYDELFRIVNEVGGLFIPAHVDRHSYSVLANLGFIPAKPELEYIEISKNVTNLEEYLKNRSELKDYKVIRNSDAHYLEDISEAVNIFNLNKVQDLF